MNPAQRVLLRRLNEGPATWADGTPLTFREELRNENAGWAPGQELRAFTREATLYPDGSMEFARGFLGGWIDEHIDFIERQRTP